MDDKVDIEHWNNIEQKRLKTKQNDNSIPMTLGFVPNGARWSWFTHLRILLCHLDLQQEQLLRGMRAKSIRTSF